MHTSNITHKGRPRGAVLCASFAAQRYKELFRLAAQCIVFGFVSFCFPPQGLAIAKYAAALKPYSAMALDRFTRFTSAISVGLG